MPTGHYPQRKPTRLTRFEYGKGYAYFVTICTYARSQLFGEVRDFNMFLNNNGKIAQACWEGIPAHYPMAELDEFVVMPNHIHGIVILPENEPLPKEEKDHATPNSGVTTEVTRARHASPLLSTIIGSYKAAVTRQINRSRSAPRTTTWQRSYHDRIIRNDRELQVIRDYIVNNPAKWSTDRENPEATTKHPNQKNQYP